MNKNLHRSGRRHVWRPRTALSYTFTSRQRNVAQFDDAFTAARSLHPDTTRLSVLQIGPGAVLNRRPGARVDGWWGRKSESLARKLPLPDGAYASYEPLELVASARAQGFELSLSIVDFSAKVLAIASSALDAEAQTPGLIQWDITQPAAVFNGRFDLIICCNVLVHVHEHEKWIQSCDNIVNWGAKRCVIITDDDLIMQYRPEFTSPAKRIYVRR